MACCESHDVDYLFGLARNVRLEKKIAVELAEAKAASATHDGAAVRRFKDFMWHTRNSWSCELRVVADIM